MEDSKIIVGRHLLPEESESRINLLKDYFCELIAKADPTIDGWHLTFNRPSTQDYYIDPFLGDGLRWWSETFGDVEIKDIPFVFQNMPGFQLSFQDSWTIYSWSQYLAGLSESRHLSQMFTVLHLDDHDDFMTPRLFFGDNGHFIDGITKKGVDLQDPETVKSAVESGAIGIGSFLSPLLQFLPRVQVRHLCSTEYLLQRPGKHSISIEMVKDTLLDPDLLRPAIKYFEINGKHMNLNRTYSVTDDLDIWLENLPAGPIFVHFDMDYFNNRYNGDSDWIYNGPKYDPSKEKVLERIDAVFEAFDRFNLADRIVNIAVALSPGFFPADLWPSSIERITRHCSELLKGHEKGSEE